MALSVVLAGCGKQAGELAAAKAVGSGPLRPLTKIVLQTDWYAQPEHGGFYQALAKGYYREAGLEVTIQQGGPNAFPLQRVALGEAQFAIGRSDDVATAVSRGIPVVGIGAYMQRDPQAIMYHDDGSIHGFKDLDGRALLTLPGSYFVPLIEKKYGIKVSVLPKDYGLGRFLADPKLVQSCFITNEPYYVRQQGQKVGVLLLAETGFANYRLWYASHDFVKNNPGVVRAFSAASIRGWRDYLAGDHAKADAMIMARNKQITPAFIAYSLSAMKQYKLVEGDAAKGEAIGRINPARLANELTQLTEIGALGRKVRLEEIYDDRFLRE